MTRQEALVLVLNSAANNQRFNVHEYKNDELGYVVDDILECHFFKKYIDWLEENGFISEVV